MHRLFLIFIVLAVFGSYLDRVSGQSISAKSQPLTNINSPKNPISSTTTTDPSIDPKAEAKSLFEEATKLMEAGQFSQAVESFQQALKLQPDYADACSALGRTYFKMQQWQKAAEYLRRATELNKKQREAAHATASGRPLSPSPETKRQPEQPKEASTQTRTNSASSSTKPAQESNANTAGVTTLRPQSEAPRKPDQRKETNGPAKTSAANSQMKLPQALNANTAALTRLRRETEAPRQAEQPKETNAAAKTTSPPSSSTKSTQEAKANTAGVIRIRPESEAPRQPEQRTEANAQTKTSPASQTAKLPQGANANPAGMTTLRPESEAPKATSNATKTAPPTLDVKLPQANVNPPGVTTLLRESEARAQPEQPKETSTTAKTTPASPDVKLPQGNVNPAGVTTLLPESEARAQPEQPKETSTAAKTTGATPDIKLPQEANATTAGTTTLRPESEVRSQPEQPKETSTAVKTGPTTPDIKPTQEANANTTGTTTLRPESEAPRQSEPEGSATNPSQSNGANVAEEKQNPVEAPASMKITSASSPLEPKSVYPIPIKLPGEDSSLTKVYRVGPSDVLDVRINGTPSPQSTLFTVTPSGLLEHPLLPEPLPVTGLTAEEIGTKFESELSKRALLESPKVAVGIRDYASHTILVSGLVRDPGTRFLRREAIPLYVVVADAQPLPEAASVTVLRNELNQVYEIDLSKTAEMNLLVRTGDVITLLPNVTQFVYIGGEVKFPGEKTFRRGLTLTQAIISSGGVTPKSKQAEITRDDGRGFLVGTRISLKDIQSGKSVDPLLRPGDRIMILR
jgi:protein involved in polysaccharide export with SLBB domain/tetratricopeptide (TPR) repeat protein